MAIDRKTPTQGVEGVITGAQFGDLNQEETGALWQRSADWLVNIAGTANVITADAEVSIAAYARPLQFWLQPGLANTGAVTININVLGAKAIVDIDGNALTSGELVAGRLHLIVYDGTAFRLRSETDTLPNDPRKTAIFYHRQNSGVAGGTATGGGEVQYPLNATLINELSIEGIVLSANQITLPQGDWEIEFSATFFATGPARVKLWNVTDVVEAGSSWHNVNASNEQTANFHLSLPLASAKTFEVHYNVVTTRASDGLGSPINQGGIEERYGYIIIRPSIHALASGFLSETRQIISGEGLKGGGDLSADRTHSLDIPGLDMFTAFDPLIDTMLVYDQSAAKHVQVPIDQIKGRDGSADIVGTSTTSLLIEAASKIFTTQINKGWGIGARLRASSDAGPTNFIEGLVSAYSGTSLTINVDLIGGSGILADWTINLIGEPSGQFPIADSTALVKDPIDGTKRVRLDVGAVSTATIRTITMPDADVDLGASGGGGFPAGTRMLFHQTAAPTGWTKDTTASLNDNALRVVTGTVTPGGTDNFSTVFSASKATDAHTLTEAEMPAHTHLQSDSTPSFTGSGAGGGGKFIHASPSVFATQSTGGGNSHSHDITLDPKYQDVIIASKD